MISVIIPAYNAAEYLPECLDSVLAQTYTDFEVIVIDDGSTDTTADLISRYAAADQRVRMIRQVNKGPSAARNAGLDAARGDRIFFIDSDDVIVPDCLERLMSMGTKDDFTVGAFSFQRADRLRKVSSPQITVYTSEEAVEAMLYQHGLSSSVWCILFPASLFAGIRFREGVWYEDLEILPRLFMACRGRIISTNALMYLYRKHEGSFIHTFDRKRLDVLKVTAEIEGRYARHPRLEAAARDRRFSASYNMFVLCTRAGMTDVAASCWATVKSHRSTSLLNPHVRLKNKIGALVSYLGPDAVMLISKLVAY